MKRLAPLPGFGALLMTAPLWMGASDCEVAVVSHDEGCSYEGQRHAAGDSFAASDRCNTCSCEDDGSVACTERACADDLCEYGGETHMIGDSFPASDGCNTCLCDKDGKVGCTTKACMGGTGCDFQGQHHATGETFPEETSCNTCTCTESGEVACTRLPCPCNGPDCQPADSCTMGTRQFASGTSVVCPDGCNTCGCDGNGWSMTDAACQPLPTIEQCDPMEQGPWVQLDELYLDGDALALQLTYGGGCEAHTFKLCWDGTFRESSPVQATLRVVDTSEVEDPCDATPTEPRVWSLAPLKQAYSEAYQTMTGTILLDFDGEAERYEF
jgi:hypothetical protein